LIRHSLTAKTRAMSVELYTNGKGQYSLEQLPDYYAFDEDEIEANVAVHTFPSQRDADFFLGGVEATGRLDMDMTATRPVPLGDGRFGVVLRWRDGDTGLSQFNH
jgi:hypothetical protein